MQPNISGRIPSSLFVLLVLFICACKEHAPPRTPPSFASETGPVTRDGEQEAASGIRVVGEDQPQTDVAEHETASSVVTIRPLLPQPIQTKEEAQACMEAALRFDRSTRGLVAENTGVVLDAARVEVLEDCAVLWFEDGRGCRKFYPGGTEVTLLSRSASNAADANVYMPGCDCAVVHVTIHWQLTSGGGTMWITCRDATGSHEANVRLHVQDPIGSSGTPEFTTGGESDWSRIAEPDRLVVYCMGLYKEFVQLRGR